MAPIWFIAGKAKFILTRRYVPSVPSYKNQRENGGHDKGLYCNELEVIRKERDPNTRLTMKSAVAF